MPSPKKTNVSLESPKQYYTVDDALCKFDDEGTNRFKQVLTIITSLSIAASTVQLILYSVISDKIKVEWGSITQAKWAWPGLIIIAQLCGGTTIAWISDRYGRKEPLRFVVGLAFLASVACSLAKDIDQLIVLRAILGSIVAGSITHDMMYYVEFMPTKTRGRDLSILIAFSSFGIIYLSILILIGLAWKRILMFSSLPFLSACVLRAGLTLESPRWLISQGRFEDAYRVLMSISRYNNIPLPKGILLNKKYRDEDLESPELQAYLNIFEPDNIPEVTKENIKDVHGHNAFSSVCPRIWNMLVSFVNPAVGLFKANVFRKTCVMSVLLLCKTHAFYCMLSWIHISLLTILSKDLQHDSFSSQYQLDLHGLFLIIYGSAQFFGAFGISKIIDRLSRRSLLLVSFIGNILVSFWLITMRNVVQLCIGVSLSYIFSVTIAITVYVFLSQRVSLDLSIFRSLYGFELFPTRTRALSLCLCSTIARLGCLIGPYIISVCRKTFINCDYTQVIIIITHSIGLVCSLFIDIETNGLDLKN